MQRIAIAGKTYTFGDENVYVSSVKRIRLGHENVYVLIRERIRPLAKGLSLRKMYGVRKV